ncbi:MAG: cation-translocating P-type ATPase [Halomonas sp.]|nr:cation-translocating P-type ATPase [Halomonas sp.]
MEDTLGTKPRPSSTDASGTAPRDATQKEEVFSVQGMWCSSCAFAVEHFLQRQHGVGEASVNFVTATAFVRWDSEKTDPETLRRRVGRLGYALGSHAAPEDQHAHLQRSRRNLLTRLVVSIAFGMWTVMASALLYFNYGLGATVDWTIALVATVLSLPVVGYAGLPFYRAAWRTLRAGRPGMDVLVSLGVFSALLFSAWHLWRGSADVYVDTAVMLVTLLLVGRLVETYSRQDGLEALASLEHLTPETARAWRNGNWQTVAIESVTIGERIAIAEGETLPFDGRLEDSQGLIDRAVLTGERTPVILTRGDSLEAGCVNAGPHLTMRVEAGVGQRYIDVLRNRTLELHARKGEFQKVSDSFARWLPTLALSLTIATFLFALLRGIELESAFTWALSVLVVACPCAVGLAIPVVTQAAGARGLRQGIVFKDLSAFEILAKARSIAFDKTGTLTTGQLDILDIDAAPDVSADDVLRLAAQAELGITHPIAQTLRRHAIERGLVLTAHVDTSYFPGQGIIMRSIQQDNGIKKTGTGVLRVGSPAWLKAQGVDLPSDITTQGKRIMLAQGTKWLGTIHLDERLATGSSEALQRFRRNSFTLALLSGDQDANVRDIALQAGFRKGEWFSGQSPESKARLIGSLPRPSVFVGDGINDTLALASATTSVSVAGATRQARDVASVSLLSPGIGGAWEAHRLARLAYRLMKQNLAFSIGYNLLALGIALWMPIPPVIAATAMTISSVSVLANASRLYMLPETTPPGQPMEQAVHVAPVVQPGR